MNWFQVLLTNSTCAATPRRGTVQEGEDVRMRRIGYRGQWIVCRQGLTLVHFSAQRRRFLWDGVHSGVVKGVFRAVRGYFVRILCKKRLRLS